MAPGGAAEYALLFYNNGRTERSGYCGRRVLWLSTGRATSEGYIRWHQPEIVLWWDGPGYEDREDWNEEWSIVDGPGYADWLEYDDGRLAFVASNKLGVRYHIVEPRLLQLLRHQPEINQLPVDGKSLDIRLERTSPQEIPVQAPSLVDLHSRGGFTLLLRMRGLRADLQAGALVADAFATITAARGEGPTEETVTRGYSIRLTKSLAVELRLRDREGREASHASSAPAQQDLWDGQFHTLAFIVDGGPRVVSIVTDETLDDGGTRPQGWGFLPQRLSDLGGDELVLHPHFGGQLQRFIIYDRALTTTEAIGAGRAMATPS